MHNRKQQIPNIASARPYPEAAAMRYRRGQRLMPYKHIVPVMFIVNTKPVH